jgi:hypothetical protein
MPVRTASRTCAKRGAAPASRIVALPAVGETSLLRELRIPVFVIEALSFNLL